MSELAHFYRSELQASNLPARLFNSFLSYPLALTLLPVLQYDFWIRIINLHLPAIPIW